MTLSLSGARWRWAPECGAAVTVRWSVVHGPESSTDTIAAGVSARGPAVAELVGQARARPRADVAGRS